MKLEGFNLIFKKTNCIEEAKKIKTDFAIFKRNLDIMKTYKNLDIDYLEKQFDCGTCLNNRSTELIKNYKKIKRKDVDVKEFDYLVESIILLATESNEILVSLAIECGSAK